METFVMPLGVLSAGGESAYYLLAFLPNGDLRLERGLSWAEAAKTLSKRCKGEVKCEAGLLTVGLGLGWELSVPHFEHLWSRAAVALAFLNQFQPEDHEFLVDFVRTWVQFYELQLWEHVPAELGIGLDRYSSSGERSRWVAGVMGQGETTRGFAVYDDPRSWDAIWAGNAWPMNGLSVVAGREAFLETSFAPFNVPCPIVAGFHDDGGKPEAHPAEAIDYRIANAVMQVLINIPSGQAEQLVAVGDGTSFSTSPKDDQPADAPAPAQKKQKKAPSAKKKQQKAPVQKKKKTVAAKPRKKKPTP
jgi:hypothetical protein